MFTSNWQTPSTFPTLSACQGHVWQLTVPTNIDVSLINLLTQEEKQKASCFKFEHDRRRFFTTRIGLKLLLANYLNTNPQNLHFITNTYGKPSLENQPLHFNISHSKDIILYAFYPHLPIGIDIEYTRLDLDVEDIAQLVFHATEIDYWLRLDEKQRIDAFFQLWTLKEAYIKAIGQGFSYPVKTLALPSIYHPFSLLTNENIWSFYPIPIPQQVFKAALVIPKDSVNIDCFVLDSIEKWHCITHCAI